MIELTPNESRVLGVLIEKAMTTPAQYPLTLSAVVTGSNQKSNRAPVMNMTEDQAFDALDALKQKGLAREVQLSGSRVEKYRHVTKEALDIDTNGVVILAELLLRGPQTIGELRGRASRMYKLDSIQTVEQALRFLMERDEPLLKEIPAAPGGRAKRYVQVLCPDLHPIETAPGTPAQPPDSVSSGRSRENDETLVRIERLEAEVAELKETVQQLMSKQHQDLLQS